MSVRRYESALINIVNQQFQVHFSFCSFDVEGYVTGFGNPDWGRTHDPASRTAPAVTALVQAGAACVGKTHMDEMAYGYNFFLL